MLLSSRNKPVPSRRVVFCVCSVEPLFEANFFVTAICTHRPVRRGTLAEHLYRAVAKPKSGENQRLRNALGKGLKYAVGGAVFYFGVALALGGRDRVRADLEKLQVCSHRLVAMKLSKRWRGCRFAFSRILEATCGVSLEHWWVLRCMKGLLLCLCLHVCI